MEIVDLLRKMKSEMLIAKKTNKALYAEDLYKSVLNFLEENGEITSEQKFIYSNEEIDVEKLIFTK